MHSYWKSLLSLILFSSYIQAGEAPVTVGPFSNFQRYQFAGNETFSTEQLRKALQSDVELIPLSRSGKSLNALFRRIEGSLIAGYASKGFPNTFVQIEWDSKVEAPLVNIREGERFRNGEILIENAPPEIEQSIRRWLIEKAPPLDAIASPVAGQEQVKKFYWRNELGKVVDLEKPRWKIGEFCHYQEIKLDALNSFVERAFNDSGYLQPKFSIQVVTDEQSKTAKLRVNVESTGEVWKIDKISFKGLTRHTVEEMTQFLEVAPGQLVTAELLLQLRQKLQQSGRFRWFKVYVNPKLIPVTPTELTINVLETEFAPKLGVELSDGERVALRFADWLNRFREQDHDLVIQVNGFMDEHGTENSIFPLVDHLHLCISPDGSFLLSFDVEDPLLGGTETVIAEFTDKNKSFILQKRGIAYQNDEVSETRPTFTFATTGLPPGEDRNVNANFSLGLSTDNQKSFISVSPFAAIYSFKEFNGAIRTLGETLHFENEFATATFNHETGRLIQLKMSWKNKQNSTSTMQVNTELGGRQRLSEEFKSQRDGSSFMQVETFLELVVNAVDAGEWKNSRQQRTYLAYQKLLNHCYEHAEDFKKEKSQEDSKFTIPPSKPIQSSSTAIAAVTLICTNRLFAENTQPWNFARELVALVALKDPESVPQLNQILQDRNNGPMMYWMFAELAAYLPLVPAENLAHAGCMRLNTKHYKRDIEQFANADGGIGKFLLELGKGFRKAPASDLQDLLPFCTEDRLLRLAEAQNNLAISDEQFTLELLDAVWHDSGIKEQLHKRLESFQSRPEENKVKLTSGEEE